jgi:cytochrome c biogenesis protein CcmG/thiol:disulfide interchange protein DsbE
VTVATDVERGRQGAVAGRVDPADPDGAGMPQPGPRRGRWFLLGVVAVALLALVVLLGWGLLRRQAIGGIAIRTEGEVGRVLPGPAPDFAIQRLDGGTFRLAEQRGQVVVMNYWASWCTPCREEAPVLERGSRLYRNRGVVFVGLDTWDTERDARAFLATFGVTYPNGPDPTGAAAIDYGVTGIPETFFVRPDGTIARHWIGPLTDAQLAAFVAEAGR